MWSFVFALVMAVFFVVLGISFLIRAKKEIEQEIEFQREIIIRIEKIEKEIF